MTIMAFSSEDEHKVVRAAFNAETTETLPHVGGSVNT